MSKRQTLGQKWRRKVRKSKGGGRPQKSSCQPERKIVPNYGPQRALEFPNSKARRRRARQERCGAQGPCGPGKAVSLEPASQVGLAGARSWAALAPPGPRRGQEMLSPPGSCQSHTPFGAVMPAVANPQAARACSPRLATRSCCCLEAASLGPLHSVSHSCQCRT